MARAKKKARPGKLDIERHPGTAIMLPEGLDPAKAAEFLLRFDKQQNEFVDLTHEIEGPVYDGVQAFLRALQAIFGFTELKKEESAFQDTPPQIRSIPISVTEKQQMPWGMIAVPGIDGYFETSAVYRNRRPCLLIRSQVKRKNEDAVDRIIAKAEAFVKSDSIYRKRALRLQFPEPNANGEMPPPDHVDFAPRFMDVSGVDLGQLVLNDREQALLNTGVLQMIRNTANIRRRGIPIHRGLLLEGPFGTGKTLSASIIAKTCMESDEWTFLYVKDTTLTQLEHAIEFAAMFPPCVLFCEDIDRAMTGERTNDTDRVLNLISGVGGRSQETIIVSTTNYVDRINPAMMRPGRFNTIISVRQPDAKSVVRLVRYYIGDMLDPTATDEKLLAAGEVLQGQSPATVCETCERSKIIALQNNHDQVTPEDLFVTATNMTEQIRLVERLQEPKDPPVVQNAKKVARVMGEGIGSGMSSAIVTYVQGQLQQQADRQMDQALIDADQSPEGSDATEELPY